jgi:hypothetical protein
MTGKLQLGNEAVPVEYELQTAVANNKRETTGRLVLRQPQGDSSDGQTLQNRADH